MLYMSDQSFHDLRKSQNESLEKYAYFLLAAAGAAIGYSLSKTDNKFLGWNLMPLGMAVLSWGLSFYFGCKYILCKQKANAINIQAGNRILGTVSPIERNKIIQEADALFYATMTDLTKNGKRQFTCLIGGVIFFVLWYVIELYIKTYPCNAFSSLFSVY